MPRTPRATRRHRPRCPCRSLRSRAASAAWSRASPQALRHPENADAGGARRGRRRGRAFIQPRRPRVDQRRVRVRAAPRRARDRARAGAQRRPARVLPRLRRGRCRHTLRQRGVLRRVRSGEARRGRVPGRRGDALSSLRSAIAFDRVSDVLVRRERGHRAVVRVGRDHADRCGEGAHAGERRAGRAPGARALRRRRRRVPNDFKNGRRARRVPLVLGQQLHVVAVQRRVLRRVRAHARCRGGVRVGTRARAGCAGCVRSRRFRRRAADDARTTRDGENKNVFVKTF